MAIFKWMGYVILACLILAAVLGLLIVIRLLAVVIATGIAVFFIALLLHQYFTSRKRDKANK